ncbi:YggT family protein [Peribacillus cavernae]|uniref:YggT family protein n=1 Tax=Peribacillus cavernae TaxID=1674310 RepID=A0A3S0UFH8_9BACI|nr:YggT family protein [Peribacillus cavernae]MDQ0217159.1 YggT family protein [Peribacillus cavernae]RUQ30367.1 YggT family protein [Peribacillus cavernae]
MLVLFDILLKLIQVYSTVLIIYLLMSWFPNARETTIGRFLSRICEPYLEPFRRIIPPFGMIDFSPIVALLVLQFAGNGLGQLFSWLAF